MDYTIFLIFEFFHNMYYNIQVKVLNIYIIWGQFEQDLLNNGYELVNSFEYNPNLNELNVTNIFIIYKGKIGNIWVEVSWFKKTNIDYGPDKYRVQLDDDTHMSIATTFVKNYSELEKFVKNYIKRNV